MLGLLYVYIDVTQFDNYVFNFVLYCLFQNSSHFSSMEITMRWRIVCAAGGTVWSKCGGVSVQQVALLWMCLCHPDVISNQN